jgi:hypothetical protein
MSKDIRAAVVYAAERRTEVVAFVVQYSDRISRGASDSPKHRRR